MIRPGLTVIHLTQAKRQPAIGLGSAAALGLALLSGCSVEGLDDAAPGGSDSSQAAGGAAVALSTGGAAGTAAGAAPGEGSAQSGGQNQGSAPGEELDDAQLLTARTWRLTHDQYERSIIGLLGVMPNLDAFAPESGNGKFANFSSTSFVQVDLAANYYKTAKTLALDLPATVLAALTTCNLEPACKDTFISELGSHAFRSEVPAEVAARLSALFDLASAEDGPETGYRAVLVAILNSPLFLYRKEIGPESDTASPKFSLTGDQIAEFLSFSLLNSPPPAWLREQAPNLATDKAALEGAMAQLLSDPLFEERLSAFLGEWLEVTHFDSVEKSDVYPGFEEAKSLIQEELQLFFEQSGRAGSGLSNLLLDPVPSVSPELDAFYSSDPSAPESTERLGVLGLGAVLSTQAKSYLTSPTLRGLFVRARFFCQEINLPEGFTPPPLSEVEEAGIATSTRELYEQHQTQVNCAVCHGLTDNIGFALESFDGVGRFRSLDTTQGDSVPIDTLSELTSSDVDRPLTGPRDLSQALSESLLVKECLARQAFRFYFGQVESVEAEAKGSLLPAIVAGREALTASDSLGQLTQGLFSTTNTTLRQREEAE